MAALRNHGHQIATLTDGSITRSYHADGSTLQKERGGRWKVVRRTGLKGDLLHAWLFDRLERTKITQPPAVVCYLSHALAHISERPDYTALLAKAKDQYLKYQARQHKAEAKRAAEWEQGRDQREREAAEVTQFAEVAIAARQAASHAICCSACGGVLDQSTTVYAKFISGDTVIQHAVALHGGCFDGLADSGRRYKVEADGRTVPAHVWRHTTQTLVGYAVLAAGGYREAR
jgi:hypothetical protein